MISFSQLLQNKTESTEHAGPERRLHRRLLLRSTPGELHYNQTKMPCQITDIGLGGCCLSVEGRFTAGALAQLEIVTTIQGQAFQLYGVTTWTRFNRRLGVRFTHPSATLKMQVEGLVCALFEQADEAHVNEVDGSSSPGRGAVLPDPIDTKDGECNDDPEQPAERFSPEFIRQVHGGSCRAVSWEDGEWPVQIRYIADRAEVSGSILDLSVKGCGMRTPSPYTGPFQVPVEVSFRIHGLPFLIAGKPALLDDSMTVGIQFSAMSPRRQDELVQLIGELRASGKYQPDLQRDEEESASAPDAIADSDAWELSVPTSTPGSLDHSPEEPKHLMADHEDTVEDKEYWSDLKSGSWDL